MTENQRLQTLMTMLNFKSQKAFAERVGIQQGSLSDILRARNGVGVSKAIKEKLVKRLNVNLEWFSTGIGPEFLPGLPEEEKNGGVPYYHIGIEEVAAKNLHERAPEYFVNYKPFNDCMAYLPVYGDSMYPKYASGEVIAIKEVINKDIIQWGEAYVVFTNDASNNLKCIKLIYEHPDNRKLILRSSNPNFKGDTIIEKQDIQNMYIIKGKITRNLI